MAPTGPRLLAEEALYDYAIQALAKRSLTVDELRKRLTRRAARPEATENVLARLTQAGYLDDKRLADSYAFFRKEYEGLGRRRVLTDLRRRGVDKNLAEDAVEESYQDADEDEMIARQLRRKLGENYADHQSTTPRSCSSSTARSSGPDFPLIKSGKHYGPSRPTSNGRRISPTGIPIRIKRSSIDGPRNTGKVSSLL